MNSFDTSIFLNRGAFVRLWDQWHLFQLQKVAARSVKNQVLSIGYRNFFDSKSAYAEVAASANWNLSQWEHAWKAEELSDSPEWQGPSRELYTKGFAQIKEKFRSGVWQKAVPIGIDRAQGPLKVTQLVSLLAQLSHVPKSLIPFGFWSEQGGVVGATPEILFLREGNIIHSMALAGTQVRNGPCTLKDDPKNLREHQIVVNELIKKWGQWGQVEKKPTEILELPALYHLLTPIQVQLRSEIEDEALVNHFHPTSALGTSPYERWQELYELPEQPQRGVFGAPITFPLAKGKTLALVALRQIQWNQKEIQLCAGGGVVHESQEELEWQEILAKMNSVKKLLKV